MTSACLSTSEEAGAAGVGTVSEVRAIESGIGEASMRRERGGPCSRSLQVQITVDLQLDRLLSFY